MKALIIVLCVVGGLALIIGVGIALLNRGMGDIRKLVINDVDLKKVADGTYAGQYHLGRWTWDLEVAVKDHRIVGIKNTNKSMAPSQPWIDAAVKAVIDRQSVLIDAVTGATISTRSFQKALENALEPAVK